MDGRMVVGVHSLVRIYFQLGRSCFDCDIWSGDEYRDKHQFVLVCYLKKVKLKEMYHDL